MSSMLIFWWPLIFLVGTYEAIENWSARKWHNCFILSAHFMCPARILETSIQQRLKTYDTNALSLSLSGPLKMCPRARHFRWQSRFAHFRWQSKFAPHTQIGNSTQKLSTTFQLGSAYLINVGGSGTGCFQVQFFHWLRFDQCLLRQASLMVWPFTRFMLQRDVASMRSFLLPLVASVCSAAEPYFQYVEQRGWPDLCKTTTSAKIPNSPDALMWLCAANRYTWAHIKSLHRAPYRFALNGLFAIILVTCKI